MLFLNLYNFWQVQVQRVKLLPTLQKVKNRLEQLKSRMNQKMNLRTLPLKNQVGKEIRKRTQLLVRNLGRKIQTVIILI